MSQIEIVTLRYGQNKIEVPDGCQFLAIDGDRLLLQRNDLQTDWRAEAGQFLSQLDPAQIDAAVLSSDYRDRGLTAGVLAYLVELLS